MFNSKISRNKVIKIFESEQKVQTAKVCISSGGKSRYAFFTSGEQLSGASRWSDDCSH